MISAVFRLNVQSAKHAHWLCLLAITASLPKDLHKISKQVSPLPEASESVMNAHHTAASIVKADLHGTIFAYDCRMRFL